MVTGVPTCSGVAGPEISPPTTTSNPRVQLLSASVCTVMKTSPVSASLLREETHG